MKTKLGVSMRLVPIQYRGKRPRRAVAHKEPESRIIRLSGSLLIGFLMCCFISIDDFNSML